MSSTVTREESMARAAGRGGRGGGARQGGKGRQGRRVEVDGRLVGQRRTRAAENICSGE